MRTFRITVLFVVVLLLCGATMVVHGDSTPKDATNTVTGKLVLSPATGLNDNLADAANWEAANGAAIAVANGVMTVTPGSSEGIAIKLKDSVWQAVTQKLGNPGQFYVEMLIRPTGFTSGNKNLGIASHISADNTQWYYGGFNGNGRMQAGESTNLKGYQNSSDGTSFSKNGDLVYYKWRYEFNNGVVNFASNDLYMGKNGVLANYAPSKTGYSGTIGVYTCGASFTIASVRVGLPTEKQTKLILETTDAAMPRLWTKYLRLIDNTSVDSIRVDDLRSFTVTATTASGVADTWTAASSNPKVLTVAPVTGKSGETFTVKGTGVGTAAIIVTNGSDAGSQRTITYGVIKKLPFVDDPYTGIETKVYPNIGATAAYPDGELAIAFDSAPKIADLTGKIYINRYSDDVTVDTIDLSNATEAAFNADRGVGNLNIGTQMARIEGNTLFISPHFGKLEYGKRYYIAMPSEIIAGTLGGKPFTGFAPAKKTWNFTTQAAPAIAGPVITVDGSQNSKAHFRTIQKALSYVAGSSLPAAEIQIAPGTYRELLNFKKDCDLTLKGMGSAKYGSDVVIEYVNGNNMNGSTNGRAVTYFSSAKTVTLLNLTIQNPASQTQVGQAETVYFNHDSGRLIARNCSFKSEQDTLLTKGYNWFYQCHIQGSTDFIWGYAHVALFEECNIVTLRAGSIICHARSLKGDKGYVFLNSTLDSTVGDSLLARDMAGTESNYDNISFVNCTVKGNLNWDNGFEPSPRGEAGPLTGWKYYGLKDAAGNAYAGIKSAWDYELTANEYKAGFATRALILGQPTSDNGVWVASNAWTPVEP